MSETHLWISTLFLSANNIDTVYIKLLTELQHLGLDGQKLYKPGLLHRHVHDMMIHAWYTNSSLLPVDDPQKCIRVLNKIVFQKVYTAIKDQYSHVYSVGLSAFPKDFLESCKQNRRPVKQTSNRSISLLALNAPKNSTQLGELLKEETVPTSTPKQNANSTTQNHAALQVPEAKHAETNQDEVEEEEQDEQEEAPTEQTAKVEPATEIESPKTENSNETEPVVSVTEIPAPVKPPRMKFMAMDPD